MNCDQIMRRKQVLEFTGLSRSTLYNYIARGFFPAPVKLGPRAVGWRRSEIDAWLASRERA
jgi:prophage regulatory protein